MSPRKSPTAQVQNQGSARPRLLVFGINYAPEETGIAPYTTGMADHFADRGWLVTVVTGVPHYPHWRRIEEFSAQPAESSTEGVDLHRRWHYIPPKQSALRRGLYEATFFATGLSGLSGLRPDAIVGVVPSLSGGLLARAASKRFAVPYGLVLQDLMGPAAEQTTISGAGRVSGVVRRLESWAVRGASQVGVIAEGFRPYIESLGIERNRITRLRNWTHVEQPSEEPDSVRRRLGLPVDRPIALHAGNMGFKQGLENVVECARLAQTADPDLLFVLMGDGNRRQALAELAQSYELGNLRFLPIQSKEDFPNVLAAADILLVNQLGTVRDMSLPGKLTSYFLAGRPIVAAVADESETAREMRESGGGVLVAPDAPALMLAALRSLVGNDEGRSDMSANGRRHALEHLTADSALAQYEAFVDKIRAANSRPETSGMAGDTLSAITGGSSE